MAIRLMDSGSQIYSVEIFSIHNLVPNYYIYKIEININPYYKFLGTSPITSVDPNNPSDPILCTSIDIVTQRDNNVVELIKTRNLGIYFLSNNEVDIELTLNLFEFPLDDGSLGIVDMDNYIVKSQSFPVKKEKKINYKDASSRSPTVFGWSCLIVFIFVAFLLMLLAFFLSKCGK